MPARQVSGQRDRFGLLAGTAIIAQLQVVGSAGIQLEREVARMFMHLPQTILLNRLIRAVSPDVLGRCVLVSRTARSLNVAFQTKGL